MSVKIMGMVWDHYPRGGGELLTALALADHADHEGANVRPGMVGLARKTRQSVRTVQMHVARMRQERWLEPVRYANGGHGRATEYRINPAWISNPADSAPYLPVDKSPQRVQSATTRVQPTTSKGASHDKEGCKALAPQPSRTVSKPSTTTRNDFGCEGLMSGVESEYALPEVLRGNAARPARELLELCPTQWRQPVLDEVDSVARRGALRRSALGLLRTLVQSAASGTFVPSRHAKSIPNQMDSPAAAPAATIVRGLDSSPQPSSQIAREALAAIRENLDLLEPFKVRR